MARKGRTENFLEAELSSYNEKGTVGESSGKVFCTVRGHNCCCWREPLLNSPRS